MCGRWSSLSANEILFLLIIKSRTILFHLTRLLLRNPSADRNTAQLEKLCPVKALEIYLRAMKESNNHYIFVKPCNFNTRIRGNLANSYLKKLLKRSVPGVHFFVKDLRLFSSTLSWLRGASFDEIRGNSYWHPYNSVVKCYFNPSLVESYPLVETGISGQ